MSDLISRQAAIDALYKIFPANPMRNDYTEGITCGAALATEYIKQLPSAEPKKGKWKRLVLGTKEYGTTVIYRCSECEELSISQYFFCPHCGAKMGETE